MKPGTYRKALDIALVALASVLLASCGGGGDEAGAPTALHLSADKVTLTGPDANTCGTGTSLVYVYGGAAPYRVDNTWPNVLSVSKTQVDHPGESFQVVAFNPNFCVDPATIVVTDSRNAQVTLTVATKVAGSTTP